MKILIASSIDPEAVEKLSGRHDVICALNARNEELRSLVKDREILIFRSGVHIDAGMLSSAPHLGMLIRAGSGLDNVDIEYVCQRGIKLITIPEPGAKAVAEMAFALMLAVSRNIVTAHQLLSKGRWAKAELQGHLITDKVLGIVGLGNIGTRVARLGAAWGMHPVGCVAHRSQERAEAMRDMGIELLSFDEAIAVADFVSLHVPLTESTRWLINADALSRMKPGAFVINLARGGVVDEKALYNALTNNSKLAGAALDVHEQEGEGKISPLASLPNVILTPHLGAMAIESQREIGRRLIELVESFAIVA